MESLPTSRDNPLFTPGPLTTSRTVKQAMLRDLGSRDGEFIDTVRRVRERLLALAGVSVESGYEAVLMQGSGTFAIESVISSVVPPEGKLLVVVNGAYGQRMAKIGRIHGIATDILECPENEFPSRDALRKKLEADTAITTVAVVHCETTSGILNPIAELGAVISEYKKSFILDSMSAFGAVEVQMEGWGVDFLVSSANKCIEGVPGFGFVLGRRTALEESEGFARTLSLDLVAQWKGLEANGQFRFTPPVQVILAFEQALAELELEGGVAGRAKRYHQNHDRLLAGMRRFGFEEYVLAERQSYVITSFRYPDHPNFDFERFYTRLNRAGFVIYPGKVSDADCFRIGTIGRLFPEDVEALLAAIRHALTAMDITLSKSGE